MMTIGIAASSSPFDTTLFAAGTLQLSKLGFRILPPKRNLSSPHYLMGSDSERSDELHALFCDDGVDAILFARGGYGAQRIIPLLDAKKISRHPKPVVGASDHTSELQSQSN